MTPQDTLARLDEIRKRANEILNSSIWAGMKPSAFMERLQYIPALLALVEWQQGEIEKRNDLLRDKCSEFDVANFLLIRTLLALIPDVVVPDDIKDYVRESAATVLSDLRDYIKATVDLKHAEKL